MEIQQESSLSHMLPSSLLILAIYKPRQKAEPEPRPP